MFQVFNSLFDKVRGKISKSSSFTKFRYSTEGYLYCTVDKYPGLLFSVDNIGGGGFFIRPLPETKNSQNYAEFEKFILDAPKGKVFKFTFWLKEAPYDLEGRLTSISDKGYSFALVKKSWSEYKRLIEDLLKIRRETLEQECINESDLTQSVLRAQYLMFLEILREKSELLKERKIKMGLYILIFLLFLFSSSLMSNTFHGIQNYNLTKAIEEYEKEKNTKVLYLVHRKRTIGLFGLPVYEFLEVYDSHRLLSELRKIPIDKDITLIVHSPGGELLAGVQIAKIFKEWRGKVRVVVPYYAMSAGTLISLAADEIVASKGATFGPIDPQIMVSDGKDRYTVSTIALLDVAKRYEGKASFRDLIYVEMSRKATESLKTFLVNEVLADKGEQTKRFVLEKLLFTDRTHDFPVFADELKAHGFNVSFHFDPKLERIIDLLIINDRKKEN